jgi:hypothetical protein
MTNPTTGNLQFPLVADEELAELERLLAAATPGPWEARTLMVVAGHETLFHAGSTNSFRPPRPQECVANNALIVALVNAAPALLARIHELETQK